MTEYYVPTGSGAAEIVEKRSRFIGHIWRISSEEEARRYVSEMKSKYYDARHNCWCCIVRDGGTLRYSDDGEPQGTAGQPMLEMFQRSGVTDVCCVVTRYFGGILLGASGLTRAYSNSATDVIRESGTVRMVMARKFVLSFGYDMYGKLNMLLEGRKIIKEPPVFGSDVTLEVAVPEADAGRLIRDINDATSALCHIVPGEKGFCHIE